MNDRLLTTINGWSGNPAIDAIMKFAANDLIFVVFAVLAVLAVQRLRQRRLAAVVTTGITLGIAIAVKLVPVIAAPAMLRRQGWKVGLAAIVTFFALYVTYVLTTGIGVLGYLPGYLTEEGYGDGRRFALISYLVTGTPALVIAVVLLLAVTALVIVFSDPSRPWLGQLVMIGATLVIVSPRYPWYGLLLIPFVVMSGRWEWMFIPLALAIHSYVSSYAVFRGSLLAAALLIVGVTILRDLRNPRSRLGHRFPGASRKLPVGL